MYGIVEKRDANGKPTGIPESADGLAGVNPDAEKMRLEQILRAQIEPRIPGIQILSIDGFPKGPVIIMRVPQSWMPPHMVRGSGAGSYRFFSRGAAGKYPLDSTQIRSAFASETIADRIRRFRDERLARIVANEMPVVLGAGPRVVLHLIPIAGFGLASSFDLTMANGLQGRDALATLTGTQGATRFNIDGLLAFACADAQTSCREYVQVFRNGAIESVSVRLSPISSSQLPMLVSPGIEQEIIKATTSYTRFQQKCGSVPPYVVLLSLIGVKGYVVGYERLLFHTDWEHRIDRDAVLLPDVVLETLPSDLSETATLLRSVLDGLWQSSGWAGCPHFSPEGQWRPQ